MANQTQQQAGTMDRNRTVITGAHENQILYAAFQGAGGQRYAGVCQVKQVLRKRGKGGETFAIVRFHGDNRMLRLGWRDANILEVRPMELEDLERYFVQRERARVSSNRQQLNMSGAQPQPQQQARRRPGRPRKHAPAPPPPPPAHAQYQSPAEAYGGPQPSQQTASPINPSEASGGEIPPIVPPVGGGEFPGFPQQ